MKLYIAEKESMAETISRLVSNSYQKKSGYFELDNGDTVTWPNGHIYRGLEPDELDPSLKHWSVATLPIMPDKWPRKPIKGKEFQCNVIKRLLKSAKSVVHAGDAGREGQLIVQEILEENNYKGFVSRAIFKDMNDNAIIKSLESAKDNALYETVFVSALARERADWKTGFNLTRAYTLRHQFYGEDGVVNVGRVFSPTLRLIVDRHLAITNFTKQDFYNLHGLFTFNNSSIEAVWNIPEEYKSPEGYLLDSQVAESMKSHILGKEAKIESIESQTSEKNSPMPFTLGKLQKACGTLFGLTAKQTLDVAQKLYDEFKLTTYPRTESPYMSQAQKSEAKTVLSHAANITGKSELIKQCDFSQKHPVFNDKKLDEHGAIIPTGKGSVKKLNDIELKVFNLITDTYLAVFMPKLKTKTTIVNLSCEGHFFTSRINDTLVNGWLSLFKPPRKITDYNPSFAEGDSGFCSSSEIKKGTTTPPKYFTEGLLIEAMVGISKYVVNPDFKKKLNETSGIGTAATRHQVFERLKKNGFVTVKKGLLIPTEKGINTINTLPPIITDPGLTALWEDALKKIEKKEMTYQEFFQKLDPWLSKQVAKAIEGVEEKVYSTEVSEKQVELCKKIADKLRLELPKITSKQDASSFIDANMKTYKDSFKKTPTEKQLNLANSIAKKKNIKVTKKALECSYSCSAFIKKHG